MLYDIFESPLGLLTVSTDGLSITGLHIAGDRYFTQIPAGWKRDRSQSLLRQAQRELHEYFAGTRTQFEVPIGLVGTSFQQAVWQALQNIPAGTTTSYSEVAQEVGRPLAVRAVGSAVGRNPICIIVPCHRVIASGGRLGGYVAGLACKQQLLDLEQLAMTIKEDL